MVWMCRGFLESQCYGLRPRLLDGGVREVEKFAGYNTFLLLRPSDRVHGHSHVHANILDNRLYQPFPKVPPVHLVRETPAVLFDHP